MYNLSTPNFVALAVNVSRIYEIAKYGNHTVMIVPGEHSSIQDIDLLYQYYGFAKHNNPDIIVELCYSPDDVMNVFRTGIKCETLADINERLPKIFAPITDTLDKASLSLLKVAIEKLKLGVNDVIKIHALSKTIARLSEAEEIRIEHVAEAVLYRSVKP